jgi:hypothetical protein
VATVNTLQSLRIAASSFTKHKKYVMSQKCAICCYNGHNTFWTVKMLAELVDKPNDDRKIVVVGKLFIWVMYRNQRK